MTQRAEREPAASSGVIVVVCMKTRRFACQLLGAAGVFLCAASAFAQDDSIQTNASGETENVNTQSFRGLDRGGSDEVARGSPGAYGVVSISEESAAAAAAAATQPAPTAPPDIHVVRHRETLWGLCQKYYSGRDPRSCWPKVWSFNPQITNPHWIYPGDQVWMKEPRAGVAAQMSPDEAGEGGFVSRQGSVPPNTVFLRYQGYIGDENRDTWGKLVGAHQEQMLLAEQNDVYILTRPGVTVRPGQQLTVFRPLRALAKVPGARMPPGRIVKIKGTVRIDSWNPKTRVARARIIESVDVVERGAWVGPVGRRFDVVPPRVSDVQVTARILTGMHPNVYMGQNQVVFLDRGTHDGLEIGNRLVVVRRGDTWRRGLVTTSTAARERVVAESSGRIEIEVTPIEGDDRTFPEEIVAELRIIRAQRYSSLALVTEASRELLVGDRAVARRGR